MKITRPVLLALFVVAAAVQLAVPARMILRREAVLRHGEVFRFRTAPVDPYDAFRGRYVALGIESREAALSPGQEFRRGQHVCVTVTNDPEGLAHLGMVSREAPPTGAWLRLRFQYDSGGRAHFYPFLDRFYMEESAAPRAETAYRESSRGTNRTSVVQVRVLDGLPVIEDLYIDHRPTAAYLRETEAKKEKGK